MEWLADLERNSFIAMGTMPNCFSKDNFKKT